MRVLFFGILLGLLTACGSEAEDRESLPEAPDDGIRSESYGVTYLFSDSAVVTARMEVFHLIEKENQLGEELGSERILFLEDSLHISFLAPNGESTSEITSNRGTYYKDKGLAILEGNVIMINERGEKMKTEQLYWDEKKEEVYNQVFTRIETPREILTSDSGIVANTEFTRWRLKGVSGVFAYPKGDDL